MGEVSADYFPLGKDSVKLPPRDCFPPPDAFKFHLEAHIL